MTWTVGQALGLAEQHAWDPGSEHGLRATLQARHFVTWVGADRALATVSWRTLSEYAASLELEGKAPATVNRYLAAVSKMFRASFDAGNLKVVPKIPRRREAQGRIRFLSREEEASMLEKLDTNMQDLVVTLVDTGMRLGEALRLEPRDLDMRCRVIHVWETKNGQPRSVPMTTRVHETLQRRLYRPDTGKIHILAKENRVFPLTRHSAHHRWNTARAKLGLSGDPQFVIHALRHTCASRLVQAGVGLRVVQEYLGHKTLAMTMRYSHLSPTQLADAAAALENA